MAKREDRVVVNAPEKDQEAPKAASTELTISDVEASHFTISWKKATDNVTSPEQIKYKIYLTNFDDETDDWKLIHTGKDIDAYTFTGLKPNTKYGFFVEAVDAAGNVVTYPEENGAMMQETDGVSKPSSGSAPIRPASNGGLPVRPSDAKPVKVSTGTRPVEKPETPEERAAREKAEREMMEAFRREKIRQYLKSSVERDSLERINVTKDREPVREYININGRVMQLVNEVYDISSECSTFMPINENEIFPGRLVLVDENLVNGKPVDALDPMLGAGKVKVEVNFFSADGGSLTEHDVEATSEGIHHALSKIFKRAFAAGALPPANVNTVSTSSNSKEKVAIDAGCSVDYLGAKCTVNTTTTKSQESFYQMESFQQGFYTVTVTPEGNDPVNYLGEKVTVSDLDGTAKIKSARGGTRRGRKVAGPLIGVIKSVTYGRIGHNIKRYDASSFTFKGDESISYKKICSATSKQDIQESSSSSFHFARIWGGSATTAGKALSAGVSTSGKEEDRKLDENFTKAMAENMEVSAKNQGVPISYTVEYLASGESLGAFLTGKYVESTYIPLYNSITVKLIQNASVCYGTDSIRINILCPYIQLDESGRVVREGWKTWEHRWSNKSEKNTTIFLYDDCYFKNNEVLVIIESRTSAVEEWQECGRGYMNIAGGKLTIRLVGSYYSHSVRPGGEMAKGEAQYK